MIHVSTYYLVIVCLFIFSAAVFLGRRKSSLPLPPGPPRHAILGNVHDVPKSDQWLAFAQLGKLYGPVVYLRVLTQRFIVLNSLDAVTELLDRRGSIYSDRPAFNMLSELMGWSWLGSLMPYGEEWRENRRVVHHFFHEDASRRYRELQTTRNLAFLQDLLHSPADFLDHIRHLAASSIMSLAYDIDVAPREDPWVRLADSAFDVVRGAGLPGQYAVDWIPWLRYIPAWFPGAGFQKKARLSREVADRIRFAPLDEVKAQINAGKSGTSVAASLLQNGFEGRTISEELIANAAGAIYIGGAESTVAVITAFVLCMVLHPAKQRAAQEEIDDILGHGRLPEFSDRPSLPYIESVLLEVYRLYPVLPLAIGHRAMEEDEYAGMRIPKGATVVPNVWSILRNENVYTSPGDFIPERYMKDGKLALTATTDPRGPLFGFGRRICPGRHFADASAWLAVATIVACFDIAPAQNKDGRDELPNDELQDRGLVACPWPFKCNITLRSAETRRLLQIVTDIV